MSNSHTKRINSEKEDNDMKEKILKLIPEFNEIKDEKLKVATLNVFVTALEKGEWKPEDLDKIPFTLLKQTDVSFLRHTRGVTQTCISAGKLVKSNYPKEVSINMDHLISGAILHDVGKLLEYKKEGSKFAKSKSGKYLRHPFSGMGIAFSSNIPEEVLHIIAVHSKEGDGAWRSPEAVILHHADFTNFEIFH